MRLQLLTQMRPESRFQTCPLPFDFNTKRRSLRKIKLILLYHAFQLLRKVHAMNSTQFLQHEPVYLHVQRVVVLWQLGNLHTQGLTVGRKLVSYPVKRNRRLVSCVKTSEAPAITKTNDDSNKQGSLEKNSQGNATFPNGFEALILDVCDETEVAELKLKVGDFEMHLKRNIGVAKHPFTSLKPPPPPIPTLPMEVSAAVSPAPSPSKSSVEKTTPFTNVSFRNSSKLAALEASGASGYVLVASPTVGSFRRNRTVKGKKQSPICKEGNVIKGQVIGYLDQFGTELPVKSDVAGEVLKLLFDDGDAVGYGDPLIAVLPSFNAIN